MYKKDAKLVFELCEVYVRFDGKTHWNFCGL